MPLIILIIIIHIKMNSVTNTHRQNYIMSESETSWHGVVAGIKADKRDEFIF